LAKRELDDIIGYMKYPGKRLNEKQFYSTVGLFLTGMVLFSVILAMSGFFYAGLLAVYTGAGLVSLIYLFLKNKLIKTIRGTSLAVVLSASGFILLFSAYSTPTIFSGRDQGSYSEAAIRLSQNHKLGYSTPASREFFKIYGQGEALNFPGFNYEKDGNLIAHFPPGYIAWLASFYSFFRLSGLVAANAVAFFVFLLSFYFLSRNYLDKNASLAAFILVATSFIFSWFFKFTLSENLALGIIFFGLYQFVLYSKNSKKLYLFSSLFSFFVLLFVKIEALAFLSIILLMLCLGGKKNDAFRIQLQDKKTIFASIFLALVYFWNVIVNLSYYKIFAKGFLHSFANLGASSGESLGFFQNFYYTFKVLNIYGLSVYIIIGLMAFAYFLKKKKYELLIPFFIVLPSFIYLLQPSVSSDHPWMLRRFVFSITPICILYSVIFLDKYFSKKYLFYIFTFLLLFSNLIIFISYLPASENERLLEQTKIMSRTFGSNDLVFVDQKATGSGFSMMTGPLNFLYGKQTVYFINPKDIDKINQSKFDQIYFIIPNDNLQLYAESGLMKRLAPVKDYKIDNESLDIKIGKKSELYDEPIELPMMKNVVVQGKIYILK
jgi:hypothetical protein